MPGETEPPVRGAGSQKTVLDKDLAKVVRLEEALATTGRVSVKYGLGLLFLICVLLYASFHAGGMENGAFIIAAGVIGGYMAINIGANDVANNVGPAVGSRAVTLVGALLIAIVCEAAGAIIAGGDVVSTISKGIIDATLMPDTRTFILAMMAALLAAALWVNLATWFHAPVSTTHSVVGAVMGAGVAATGLSAVNWTIMGAIVASWVVSPVMGGIIAAGFLAIIEIMIFDRLDRVSAARRWVPILVAIMASAFSIYLIMKGLKRVWRPDITIVLLCGALAFGIAWYFVRKAVDRASRYLDRRRQSIASLFTIPLICAAALLSFAHGANDVANAVGPLAAIVSASASGTIDAKVTIPLWVMLVGAVGISAGLALFGPRLIRTVGTKITKLDRTRAFTIALAAAITVIIASAFGLPVSSTHIALGALFGVGLFRESLDAWRRHRRASTRASLESAESDAYAAGLFEESDLPEVPITGKGGAKKARKRKLVRRQHLLTIVTAWLVTVPLTAILAAGLYVFLQALPLG